MEKNNEKHFGLRVDGDILAKFRFAWDMSAALRIAKLSSLC